MVRRAFLGAMLVAALAGADEKPGATASFAAGAIPGTVRYQVVLQGVARDDIRPTLGSLENLKVVAGPLISREVAWREGETAAVTVVTWVLRAVRPGAIAVGSSQVAFAGVSLQTKAVRGGAFLPVRSGTTPPRPSLRLQVSPPRVVVGEPFVAEFLIDRIGLAGVADWEVRPSFPESWSEPLPAEALRRTGDQAGEVGVRAVGGWLVFPARAGNMVIPEAIARPVSPADQGEDELIAGHAFTSAPASVEVAPLPPAPADFFGGVGELTVTRRLVPAQVRDGELAELELEVAGRGNFPLMFVPACPLPAGLKAFPPEDRHAWRVERAGLVGTRIWRIPVAGERIGTTVLPPATLATFEPGKGYVEHALPALSLTVEPAAPAPSTSGSVLARPAKRTLSPIWIAAAFLAGALLACTALGLRSRRRASLVLPPASEDPQVELARLADALERWCLVRFGVRPHAGEAALRRAGCAAAAAAEVAAVAEEIAGATSATGLGDASGATAALRERVRELLTS